MHTTSRWPSRVIAARGALLMAGLVVGPAARGATFTVVNVDASGPGSLQQALLDANANPGPDAIVFAIPEELCSAQGVCTIDQGATDLPAIMDGVDIDGTTQPAWGTAPANVCATETAPSRMRIEITTSTNTLFSIQTEVPTSIRGLAVIRRSAGLIFPIAIEAAGAHRVQCDHVNLDAAGHDTGAAGGASYGVSIAGTAQGAVVGTDGDGVDDVAERNVFGPASVAMVDVNSNNDNVIAGNYFGLEADGATPVPSDGAAVHLRQFSAGNRIGSNQDGVSDEIERNVIGNVGTGVLLELGNFSAQNNQIVGNWIGLDTQGLPAGNGTGVRLAGFQSVGDHNQVIRANRIAWNGTGILVEDALTLASSTNNCVVDNGVGLEHAGTDAVVFAGNWWGDASGPAGVGGGSGDEALETGTGSLTVAPWRTTPPAGVCQANLLTNGDFDSDATGWGSSVNFDGSVDWLGAPDSGSLHLVNDNASPNSGMGPGQCVAIRPGAEYDLGVSIQVPPGQASGDAWASLSWWNDARCLTDLIGVEQTPKAPQTGRFERVELLGRTAPPGARYAKVTLVDFKYDAGGLFQAWYDHVEFVPEPGSAAAFAAALLALAALVRRPARG
jgi:hypothetical protein